MNAFTTAWFPVRVSRFVGVLLVLLFYVLSVGMAQPSKKTPASVGKDKKAAVAPKEDSEVLVAPADTMLVESLLRAEPEKFQNILDSASTYHVQILYTEINRDKKNKPSFVQHAYRLNAKEYFYPASSVKFAASLLALEKVNNLRQKLRDEELTRSSPMQIDSAEPWQHPVRNDKTSKDSNASIEHFIKKVLLVSDNDGYNRLYEFLGQEYLNDQLAAKGFKHFKITTRLSAGTNAQQNKVTNQWYLFSKTGRTLFRQPSTTATKSYDSVLVGVQNLKQGLGYIQKDTLVREPKDFSTSNYIALATLQEILKTVMFPDAVPPKQRFNLTQSDYDFLYKYMSMLPRESNYPRYDTSYYDGFVKFFLYGDTKDSIPPNIRIFNKVGDAYGYLIDNAYIVDFENEIEFLLSAVIYVNKDEIFNDDVYEYEAVGLPFMAHLGRTIYKYEKERKRAVKPVLSALKAVVGPEPGYDPKAEALREIAAREAAKAALKGGKKPDPAMKMPPPATKPVEKKN
jgi:hypothetical protein